jgi:hypothetical protein
MKKQNKQNETSKTVVSMLVLSVSLVVAGANASREIGSGAKKLRFGVSELSRQEQGSTSIANVNLAYEGGIRGVRSRPDSGTGC